MKRMFLLLLSVIWMAAFVEEAPAVGITFSTDTLYVYCGNKTANTPEQKLIVCEIFTVPVYADTLGTEVAFYVDSMAVSPLVSSQKNAASYWGYLQEIYTYATVLDTVDAGAYFSVAPVRSELQSLRYSLDQMSGSKSLWTVTRSADALGVIPDTLEITLADTTVVPADTTIIEGDTTITAETVTIVPADTTHRGYVFSEMALLMRLGTAKVRLDSLAIIPDKPFVWQ